MIDCRCLSGRLYVWNSETHERLGVMEPMQWLSETDIPHDQPLSFTASPLDCGCESS